MKEIKLLKNRSDIGAGTRGADLGIDAIEIAAINQHNGFFNEHPFVDVPSHNETIYNKKFFEIKHRLGFVLEQCQRVCNSVSEILKQTLDTAVVKENGKNKNVKGIRLTRNFGKYEAILAGLNKVNVQTKKAITIDCDLQYDPSYIDTMLELMDTKDVKIVEGVKDKKDNSLISKFFNSILMIISFLLV